jgi:hypothetical protein
MEGLTSFEHTQDGYTTKYIGINAMKYFPDNLKPTGLFMTFGMNDKHNIKIETFNPADPTLPFNKFGFYWNGVLICGISVVQSFNATFCGIKSDDDKERLGRWTWIKDSSVIYDGIPTVTIPMKDTRTDESVSTLVCLLDYTYVNVEPDYRDRWFPINIRGAEWLGQNKPAIDMTQFKSFIDSVLNGTVILSDPPVLRMNAIFGDNEYLDKLLKEYNAGWEKLLPKDKCKDNLSSTAKLYITNRHNILHERKHRIEILKRIGSIILLMKDSEPILNFYKLWLEMMTKTMSNNVPDIPLFQKFSSRLPDFDSRGHYNDKDRTPLGSISDSIIGLPRWKRGVDTYENMYGKIQINNPETCRVNSDEIKDLIHNLYYSTSVKEVKSLIKHKGLLIGTAVDKNLGCSELATKVQQDINGFRTYVRDLQFSAGGRIKRKLKTRRKSRKVRNGRRKSRKSRRNRLKLSL